jgi:hypothetical protein
MPQPCKTFSTWFPPLPLRRLLLLVCTLCLSVGVWGTPPAIAFNAPELLPEQPTPVIDLARALTTVQEEKLVAELNTFEAETGWKLRVLTQFDRTPGLALRDFWNLDQKSILLVADSRGGNLLNFNVGDAVYPLLPRVFWVELQTRFGNQFFVRDNGEDQSILQALASIETCLQKGGCQAVPGLPQEQWILTLVTSMLGGVICGVAARPRKEGQLVAWQWALIFSPLWGMLFISFGIGPVVSRTSDWLPLFRNFSGFAIATLVAFLVPIQGQSSTSET